MRVFHLECAGSPSANTHTPDTSTGTHGEEKANMVTAPPSLRVVSFLLFGFLLFLLLVARRDNNPIGWFFFLPKCFFNSHRLPKYDDDGDPCVCLCCSTILGQKQMLISLYVCLLLKKKSLAEMILSNF